MRPTRWYRQSPHRSQHILVTDLARQRGLAPNPPLKRHTAAQSFPGKAVEKAEVMGCTATYSSALPLVGKTQWGLHQKSPESTREFLKRYCNLQGEKRKEKQYIFWKLVSVESSGNSPCLVTQRQRAAAWPGFGYKSESSEGGTQGAAHAPRRDAAEAGSRSSSAGERGCKGSKCQFSVTVSKTDRHKILNSTHSHPESTHG